MTLQARCAKCFVTLGPEAKFCPRCGTVVQQQAAASAPAGSVPVGGGAASAQLTQPSPAQRAGEDPWAPAPTSPPQAYSYPGQPLCPRCNTPRQFGSSQCLRCGAPFSSRDFTPGIPGAVTAEGVPAGFWIRLAAYIIDTIIVWVAFFILVFVLGALAIGSSDSGDGTIDGVVLLGYLILLLAVLAYYVVPLAHWGTTPGKKALGIYVLNEDGRRDIGYLRAIGRLLGQIPSGFFYIGYIMIGLRNDKRGLHDLIANTYPTVITRR